MGTRIGAWKTKNCQLTVWQNPEGISFQFGKHYKDKKTGEWKESKKLYADELPHVIEMFRSAVQWSQNREKMESSTQVATPVASIVKSIVNKLQE